MRTIKESEFNTTYDILESSFIPAELKPRCILYEQWMNGEVQIYGIELNAQIAGAITLWEFDSFVFAENFAVNKFLRNKGVGAQILKDVIKTFESKRIILEVEPPINEIQKRRIGFYERNGFTLSNYGYIQPSLRSGCEDVELIIMYTGAPLSSEEFERIRDSIFKTVYKYKID